MNLRLDAMRPMLLLALAMLTMAGCTGLPEGAADFGDTVTVRYSAADVDGTVIRTERTATFVVGSGDSGLGLGFERGVRGLVVGENASFVVSDDPSLGLTETVQVPRFLQPIPMHQGATRTQIEGQLGPVTVGQQFPAFLIYTGTVTAVTAARVNFTISTSELDANGQPTVQEDDVEIGATLVSTPDGIYIQRELRPDVGEVFQVDPPTPQEPNTPLGLTPGAYRTVGLEGDDIVYLFSSNTASDLVGRDVRFKVTVTRVVAGDHEVEPVDGNYVTRNGPYLKGDPESILTAPTVHDDEEDAGDGHGH